MIESGGRDEARSNETIKQKMKAKKKKKTEHKKKPTENCPVTVASSYQHDKGGFVTNGASYVTLILKPLAGNYHLTHSYPYKYTNANYQSMN